MFKRLLVVLIAVLSIHLLAGETIHAQNQSVTMTFDDGNIDGWSFKNASNWEAVDGVLRQKKSGSTSGNWLQYYAAIPEVGGISMELNGDFQITFKVGFNESAYPMQDATTIGGSVWQRSMAVGIMKDSQNALLATFYRSNGKQNGIAKITGGSANYLYAPFTGQGMGQDVHDIREIRIQRSSGVVTAWADGRILYQGFEDGSVLAGYPVICSRGPAGLALDEIKTDNQIPLPPAWLGPDEIRSFEFCMSDLDSHTITSMDGGITGTVEGGTKEEGAFMGWWTEEGAAANRWSWAAAGGVLTIQNWTMAENATIETWFKVPAWPSDVTSVPLFHMMFDGSLINSEWSRERGGPIITQDIGAGTCSMDFHEFGWIEEELQDLVDLSMNEWHHFAWVREGETNYLYIDFEEFASFQIPRYGTTELTGMQINMANNADHDWVRKTGTPLLLIARVAASDEALNPQEFKLGEQAIYTAQLATTISLCDFNGDGNINISDVIALLLFQRNNPGDLGGDYNFDGVPNVSDAIALLLAIHNGTCPDNGGGVVTPQEDCFN